MPIAILPLLFPQLGFRAVLRLSPTFLIIAPPFLLPCHFHRYRPFYRCSASNIAAFHSRLDLELPFLLWSCRRHIHFAAKDFVVTTGCCPVVFFAFLVVVLHVIFMLLCCSYCHSTGSNSHTVVLSKPASFSRCSIVLCPRKNMRTHLPISYGCVRYRESTAVVRLQYVSGRCKSTMKVRRKVRRTYS